MDLFLSFFAVEALAHQVDDQRMMLEDVKAETASRKEETRKLKSATDIMQRDLEQAGRTQQNVQSDITELQQSLEQAQQRLKTDLRGNEDRLIESMQEVDGQVTRRLEDTRVTMDKQSRALTLLQHSSKELERTMEGLKRQAGCSFATSTKPMNCCSEDVKQDVRGTVEEFWIETVSIVFGDVSCFCVTVLPLPSTDI